MNLHPELEAAVRRLVLQAVQHHAAPRAEVEALRTIVFARLCALTAEDRDALESLLPARALDEVAATVAAARNEWVRQTAELVAASLAVDDDDEAAPCTSTAP